MDRIDDVKKFVDALLRLQNEYNVKIVADNPDQEIMYFDEQEKVLYHYQNGNIEKW